MSHDCDPPKLPPEIVEFLVRILPSRALWTWLSEEPQSSLKQRVTQGFRATREVLRQPVARARLVSHLQTTPDDFESLLQMWADDSPKALEAVRAQENDAVLIAQLPVLQALHGEALVLALLREEREAAVEAWAELGETREEQAQTPLDESAVTADATQQIQSLEKQLQRAQSKLEQLRTKAHEAKSAATQTERLLQEKLREQEKAAREAVRNARQFELKLEVLQCKLEEADKLRDRAERKTRSTQTEADTAQAETKTLRRQVHRLQQINEELRRRLSTRERPASKKIVAEVIPATEPKYGTHTVAPVSQPDNPKLLPGLQITLEEVQSAVDRNDEVAVATAAEQLRELREHDAAAAQKVIKQVRTIGRYYEKVLCAATTRVLVDASNVARHDGPGKGKLSYLHAMRDELRRCEFFPVLFVADASLPYHIDVPDEFRQMMKTGEVLVSASGQEADEILARMARETGAYVVTNDRNFHRHLAPAFKPVRIGFQIFDKVVVLDEY